MKVRNKNVCAEMASRVLSDVGSGLVIPEQRARYGGVADLCVTIAVSTGKKVDAQIWV